jgi:hypothetical protein
MTRNWIPGLAVAALAIGVRLPTALHVPDACWSGTENERVAASLARGAGFRDAFGAGCGPTAHVSPAYPLILSGLYRVFGDYRTPTGRLAQQCLSLVITTATVLLLLWTARKLGLQSLAGWAAAVLAAALPDNRLDEVRGSHDQVLGALVFQLLVASLSDLSRCAWTDRRALIRGGLMAGLAMLTAPNLVLVPVLVFLVELIRGRGERMRILGGGLVFAAVVCTCLVPWMVRNFVVFDEFIPLRDNLGLELAVGNNPLATGHTYSKAFDEIHPYGSDIERERLARMGEPAFMRDKRRQALAWIIGHPGRFLWLTLRRMSLFWFTTNEQWYALDFKLHPVARLYGLIGLAAILELARLILRKQRAGILLGCAVLGAGIPYFLTHVEMRYRLPVVGGFSLLSSNVLVTFVDRYRARPRLSVATQSDPPAVRARAA